MTAKASRRESPHNTDLLRDIVGDLEQGVCVIDADLRIAWCNDRFVELLDYPDHLVGSGAPFADLVRYDAERGSYGPGDIAQLITDRLHLLRGAGSRAIERVTPDGRTLTVRTRPLAGGGFVQTCIFAPAQDGTGDADIARYRSYAEAASDWFWETDDAGQLTYLSDPFFAAVGLEAKGVLGRRLTDIGANVERNVEVTQAYEDAVAARRPFRDLRYTLAGAQAVRHVRISGRPHFDRGDRFLGYRGSGTDATEEVEAALAADQIRWQLYGAIESFSEGLALFDADDRLLFCNNRYREFYTQVADNIRPGIGFEDLIRLKVASGLFAESDRSADELISLYLGLHKNPRHSMEVRLKNGRWLRVTDRKTKDGGIVCVRTDITELKRRESSLTKLSNELRTQILRFDTALNNMIQGLCLFDSEQRLIVCNQRYLEMYRFSPEIVKPGITLREIMEYSVSIGNYSAEDAQRAIAERPMHAAKRRQATLLQRLKDGRVMAVMHQPMADGSSVATYEDVTQRVRAEDGLRAYATKLEQSNRELQHFASIASHDLQEPLRKIEAFGDRLQAKYAESLDDNGKMYISRMQIAASRMRTLINDLLMYSRVTTKAKPFVATDLNQIAQDVVSDLQITIERANGRVEIDALPTIDSDATQMRQLLQNLISNALKFRHEGVAPVVRITGGVLMPPDPIPDPLVAPAASVRSAWPTMGSVSRSSISIGFSVFFNASMVAMNTKEPASGSPPVASWSNDMAEPSPRRASLGKARPSSSSCRSSNRPETQSNEQAVHTDHHPRRRR